MDYPEIFDQAVQVDCVCNAGNALCFKAHIACITQIYFFDGLKVKTLIKSITTFWIVHPSNAAQVLCNNSTWTIPGVLSLEICF